MMVISFILMSDSLIAGAFIGENASAGVTLVLPIFAASGFFGSLFSLGIPIMFDRAMGNFNKEQAHHIFGFGLLASVSVGIALFLFALFLGDIYIRMNNPSHEVLEFARGYLYWIKFSVLVLPVQMLLSEMVFHDGDETISTIASIVQGLGNVAASIILANVIGIQGIGLASFLFNIVSMMILGIHFLRKTNSLRFNIFFSSELILPVFRFGIIDASTYLYLAILAVVFNAFVPAHFGAEYLILVSALVLIKELHLVFDGIGEALSPIVSIYLGEECYAGVRSTYRLAKRSAIIEGIIATILLLLFAPIIPVVLHVSDPIVFETVTLGVRLFSLSSAFVSLLYLLTSYFLLRGKILLGTIACGLRDVFLYVPLGVIGGLLFGMMGMLVGLSIAPILSYLIALTIVTLRYGKDNSPLMLKELEDKIPSKVFGLVVEPNDVVRLTKDVKDFLKGSNIEDVTIGRVEFLLEEFYMLVHEKNDGKPVQSECAIILRPEGVQIVERDNGILFDIAEDENTITSLTSYVVSLYIEKLNVEKKYLKTMSFNRSSFLVKHPTD